MKKILSLLALIVFSCMGAWAATTTQDVVASTNETTPEHPFYVIGTSNGYYWNSTTGPTQNAANVAVFAFYATGDANQYYIKNVTTNKWLKYTTAASYTDMVSFVDFDSSKSNASKFHFAKASNKTNNTPCYEICPIKTDGSKAGRYLNWFGGVGGNGTYSVDDSRSIGVWQQNAPTDAGSGWSVLSAELDYVKFGTGEYFVSVNSDSQQNYFYGSTTSGYQYYDGYNNPSASTNLISFSVERGDGKCYKIKDNRSDVYVAYTTSQNHATQSVRPLIGANAENTAITDKTNWMFQSKRQTWGNGFTIGPSDNNASINWNKHGDYLGLWGNYDAASVVTFVPANVETMNLLLADVKAKEGVLASRPAAAGVKYNAVASAFYGQNDYTEYSFSIAKELVAAYYSEATMSVEPVSYRINDTEGNALFEGYCDGVAGTSINLVGFDGMLSDESWDGSAYTATLTYPFTVSTEEVSNYTYISVNNDLTHLLFNSDGNVKMNHNVLPNNGNNDNYKWAIIPSCRDGVLTFKIKNYNGKYIYGTSTTNANTAFALSANATGYCYGTCIGSGKGFYVPGTNYFLSINSPGQQNQNLFIWSKSGTTHQGSNLKFSEPTDFDALMTRNQEAISTLESTYTLGTGLGEYSANEAYNNAKEALAAVNAGTAFFTKAEFDSNLGALVAGNLTINQPAAGKFYTFKGVQSNKYMTVTNGALKEGATENAPANIFYVEENEDKVSILSYTTGLYVTGTSLGAVGAKAGFEFGQAHAENGSVLVGEYRIRLNGVDLCSWGNGDIQGLGSITKNDWEGWAIEEVEALPVNIATAGFGTFYTPVPVRAADGVTVYTATVEEGNTPETTTITYTALENGEVPANTAVLVKGEAGATTMTIIDATSNSVSENALIGKVNTEATPMQGDGDKYIYTLTSSGAFKYYTGANLAGFKCHLEIGKDFSGVSASNFRVVFEDGLTTGIEAVESKVQDVVFDLQGRRVNNAQKGLYITNGRKVIR